MKSALRHPQIAIDPWLTYSGLMVSAPLSALCLALLWTHDLAVEWQWTLTAFVMVLLVGLPLFLHRRLLGSLRCISNAVLSLKDGDFSIQLETDRYQGVLRQTVVGLNALTAQLYNSRTDAAETHELLKKVMRQIDVVVLTFNAKQQLMRINDRGLTLLAQPRASLIGQTAETLGLAGCFAGLSERTEVLNTIAPHQVWQLRRSNFRERGKSHYLITLADLTAVLGQQELHAWQRMMKVLRHEISNSLAPVQSYAQTIEWLISQQPLPSNWQTETQEGLAVIISRTKALNHLLSQYKELTALPKPQRQPTSLKSLVTQACLLQTHCPIDIDCHLDVQVNVDKDQLIQLLLNLLNNGYEAMASLERPRLQLSVHLAPEHVVAIHIDDQGPGLASFDNLFVPFYTTKPQGSGIGLVLSRQIAQAHGGTLQLLNKEGGGCRAIICLPVIVPLNTDN